MNEHYIYKYSIPFVDEYEVDVPVGSKILSVAEQNNKIVLYALVSPGLTLNTLRVRVIGTGHLIGQGISEFKFLGTVNIHDGQLMFHVFYQW